MAVESPICSFVISMGFPDVAKHSLGGEGGSGGEREGVLGRGLGKITPGHEPFI